MGRPVPRQFMRNAWLDLTTIVPATAYHRRSYAERYSRSRHGQENGSQPCNTPAKMGFMAAFGDSRKRNTICSAYTSRRGGQVRPSFESRPRVHHVGPDGPAMACHPTLHGGRPPTDAHHNHPSSWRKKLAAATMSTARTRANVHGTRGSSVRARASATARHTRCIDGAVGRILSVRKSIGHTPPCGTWDDVSARGNDSTSSP